MRVVHYLNQFFGGLGGEDKAGSLLEVREGAVGPGLLLEQLLGSDAKVIMTLVCGDNYAVEKQEAMIALALDKIREAGINVIKLYGGNPDLNAGAPGTAGNWKDFLDYCYNGGNRPVYVVMFSYTQGGVIKDGGTGLDNYIRQYDELVKSTVKHPAIFGYAIGNEIFDSVSQSTQFWINFGKLIDAAHGAGVSQGFSSLR